MEGKKCTKTGLWMVPIKDEANSNKRANFMHVNNPNDTHFGVNQQVNDDMKAHFGGSNYFTVNAILSVWGQEIKILLFSFFAPSN